MRKRFRVWRYRVFQILLNGLAFPILHLGPREYAQRRAFICSRLIAPVIAILLSQRGPDALPLLSIVMNGLITHLNRMSPGLPLDIRVQNFDLVESVLRNGHGAIVATVHTQLGLTAHGVLRHEGRSPLFVGYPQQDMTGWNWGHPDPLEAVDAAASTLFLKLGAALDEGRIAVVFVDFANADTGQMCISSNLFAWAHRMQMSVLHMCADIGPDGEIQIIFNVGRSRPGDAKAWSEEFSEFIRERLGRKFEVCRPKLAMSDAGVN